MRKELTYGRYAAGPVPEAAGVFHMLLHGLGDDLRDEYFVRVMKGPQRSRTQRLCESQDCPFWVAG